VHRVSVVIDLIKNYYSKSNIYFT